MAQRSFLLGFIFGQTAIRSSSPRSICTLAQVFGISHCRPAGFQSCASWFRRKIAPGDLRRRAAVARHRRIFPGVGNRGSRGLWFDRDFDGIARESAGRVKLGTVGLPLEGTDCRIAEDGEILLRGPNIFKCYFRDLMATEDAIDSEGWFHSGDVGMIDEAGFLRVTDRKKDLIVTSGGKKVAPQKLENLLKADPLIQQALIVGQGQPHLTALLSLDRKQVLELAERSGVRLDRENFVSHPWVQRQVREILLRTNKMLAPYEAIRSFHILEHEFTVEDDELTATLKPRRHIIAQRYRDLIEDLYRAAS